MAIDTADDGSELDSPDGFVYGAKGAKPAPDLRDPTVLHTEDASYPAPELQHPPVAEDTTPTQIDRVDPNARHAEASKQASATDSADSG